MEWESRCTGHTTELAALQRGVESLKRELTSVTNCLRAEKANGANLEGDIEKLRGDLEGASRLLAEVGRR